MDGYVILTTHPVYSGWPNDPLHVEVRSHYDAQELYATEDDAVAKARDIAGKYPITLAIARVIGEVRSEVGPITVSGVGA